MRESSTWEVARLMQPLATCLSLSSDVKGILESLGLGHNGLVLPLSSQLRTVDLYPSTDIR